jgi:type I restriction enzyme S subunit
VGIIFYEKPMSEWKEYKLGDLLQLEYGKSLMDYRTGIGEYEVFGTNGKIGLTDKYLFNEPSIIIGRKGAYREVHFAKNPFFVIDTAFYTKKKNEKTDTIFMYYWFKNVDINAMDSGSAIPSTSKDEVYQLEISLPPLPEQIAIAAVLSSLDNKIDLLHRQNATLEKMAETLFRQWFVEEAKEEWKVGKLGDLVIIKYGKDHKKLLDGNIPVFGSGGLMRHADKALYDKESVLIPRKGSLNNVMFFDEPFWTVDTMFYTEMKKTNISKFVYHFVKELDLASMNVGSAVPSMTTEVLNNIPIDIPSNTIFEKFKNAVAPIYNKIKFNQSQIRTLTRLRDTLLPKLMNGEVRVNKK